MMINHRTNHHCYQRWMGVWRCLQSNGGQGGALWAVWQGGHVRHVQQSLAGADAASGWAVVAWWLKPCHWRYCWLCTYYLDSSLHYRYTKVQVQMFCVHKSDRWAWYWWKKNLIMRFIVQRAGWSQQWETSSIPSVLSALTAGGPSETGKCHQDE